MTRSNGSTTTALRWGATTILSLLGFAPAALAAPSDRYILRTKAAADVAGIESRHGLKTVRTLDNPANFIFLVQGPAGADPDLLENEVEDEAEVNGLERVKDLELPELNAANLNQSVAAILDTVSDQRFVAYYGSAAWNRYVNQPAGSIIKLPQVRPLATGTGATVAIIDTGVAPNHPALSRSLVPGFDFTRNQAGTASEWADLTQSVAAILDQGGRPQQIAVVNQSVAAILDQSVAAILDTRSLPAAFGHGTMVAGVIHLVAPTAKIMPLKAFTAAGTANTFDIVRAIYYAVEHGANVINMSFSLVGQSRELMHAINFATERGVVCVASAGNSAKEGAQVFPAAYRSVISVASTSNVDARSAFSNYGDVLIHVAAPGEGVITTYPGGHYAGAWGTSFSAPFVAGAAALMRQVDPATNGYKTASDLGDRAEELGVGLGQGRLDAYAAVTKRRR